MPEYRVVAGTHRTQDGERVEAGETVELSEEERERFPNTKFERVESDDTTSDEPAPEPAPTDDTTTEDDTAEVDESDEASEPLEVNHEDPTVTADSDDLEDVEASGDVPEDYTLLSKMAKHYDGEEVHGSMSGDELQEFFGDLSDTEVAHLKESAREELNE